MVKTFFLIFFPLLVLFTFSIYIYILFLWHQFSLQKNLLNFVWNTRYPSKKLSFILLNFLKCLNYIYILFIVFFFYIMRVQNIEFKLFFLNNLIVYQLFIYSLVFFFLNIIFVISPNFVIGKSVDIGFFLMVLFVTSFLLLTSNNILIIFINLEVINALIIYSFFISSYLNLYLKKNLNFSINWVLNSSTYQFILNFFSSILFFIIFNLILIYTNSTNFIFLNFFFNSFDWRLTVLISLLYLSLFIKFGIGPWIFFKIEIYQGFNLFLLGLYTIMYFLIILVFFFNLFIIFGMAPSLIFLILLVGVITIMSIFFIFFIFFYFNIFMFFSFSSLLNLVLLLVQWSLLLKFN